MAIITKEELLKIAHISQVRLYDEEIDSLVKQIGDLLSYAARVQELALQLDLSAPSYPNVNVMRPDIIEKTDSKAILSLAPAQEENYFVVPKIIDTK